MLQISITVLVEDSVTRRALKAEHGLALWLSVGSERILFDAGQSALLTDNAKELGIDLGAVGTILISHGHYDHCGGMADALLKASGDVTVHMHPKAIEPKYRLASAGVRDIGMPSSCRAALLRREVCLRTSASPAEIAPGVFMTGEIPRAHPEEQTDEGFRADAAGQRPDLLQDDQALFLETPSGTIVLLGCAHAGVINTLEHIRRLTDGRPFHTVFGGMHLGSASDARIAWTVESLRQFSIARLYPAHCTGARATAALWTAFPERCFPGCVGTMIDM